MGLVECLKHGLVEPFSVFWEKEGQLSIIIKILCYYICLPCIIIIINDIYPGSSTHSKVVFREILHSIELE